MTGTNHDGLRRGLGKGTGETWKRGKVEEKYMTPKISHAYSRRKRETVVKVSLRRGQPGNDHRNSYKKTPPPFLPDEIGPATRSFTGVGLYHRLGFRCLWRCRGGLQGLCGPGLCDGAGWCRLWRWLGGGWVRLPSYRLTHVWQVAHRGSAVLRVCQILFRLGIRNGMPRGTLL